MEKITASVLLKLVINGNDRTNASNKYKQELRVYTLEGEHSYIILNKMPYIIDLLTK